MKLLECAGKKKQHVFMLCNIKQACSNCSTWCMPQKSSNFVRSNTTITTNLYHPLLNNDDFHRSDFFIGLFDDNLGK